MCVKCIVLVECFVCFRGIFSLIHLYSFVVCVLQVVAGPLFLWITWMSRREQPRRKCKSKTQSQGLSVLELAKAVVPSASRSDNSSIVVSPEGSRVSSVSDRYSSATPVPARSVFTDTSLTVRSEGNTPVSDISPPELASPRSVRRKSLSDISFAQLFPFLIDLGKACRKWNCQDSSF